MGLAGDISPDPRRASGFACPELRACPPPHLASALVFSSCHPRPHSFASHSAMGGDGYAIRTIRELLGQKQDVKAIIIHTNVLNRGGKGVRNPADTP